MSVLENANCRSDPGRWFDSGEDSARLCAGCPLFIECGRLVSDGINMSALIFGGSRQLPEFDDVVPFSGCTVAGRWFD